MNLSLQMPFVGPALQGGRVVRWAKKPGDSFVFGDELCIVSIEQVLALRKTQTASILGGSKRRRRRVREGLEQRESVGLLFQVVASEPGTIRRLLVEVGQPAKVGDVLAVLTAADSDDTSAASAHLDDLPSLRVVANPVDPEEG